jgi:hypothetical protein
MPHWDTTGKHFYVYIQEFSAKTYPIPVVPSTGLPKIPTAGIARIEDLTALKGDAPIPLYVETAVSPSVYAYTRDNTRRNLYRIPLP